MPITGISLPQPITCVGNFRVRFKIKRQRSLEAQRGRRRIRELSVPPRASGSATGIVNSETHLNHTASICGDVDLFHLHHRIEPAHGDGEIGDRFRWGTQSKCQDNLCPGSCRTRLSVAAVADDRVPVAIRFSLVSGCDLKRSTLRRA